jgi:geranylgeranyl pyrophosphate synthase
VTIALDAAEEELGPELATAAGQMGAPDEHPFEAATIAAMLEAAELAEAQVHRLRRPIHVVGSDVIVWGLAGGWLRARAAEQAAGLGPTQLGRTSAALGEIAEGWMCEARDLYDAGRSTDRYLAAAKGARGALGSLSCALGAMEAGLDEGAVVRLAECGSGLATAARIRDDLMELSSGSASDGAPAGTSLTRGVYTLPVIASIERDRGLAQLLGGAIAMADLAGVVDRIWAAGGPIEAGGECRRLTQSALSAMEGGDGTDAIAAVGQRILADCELVVA